MEFIIIFFANRYFHVVMLITKAVFVDRSTVKIYQKFNHYALFFLNTRPLQFFNVLLANRRVQLLCQNAGNALL